MFSCLVVGGGLLLVSLLGFIADTDADTEVNSGWGMAGEFASVRVLIYFLAGFGATGFLLERFGNTSGAAALLCGLTPTSDKLP